MDIQAQLTQEFHLRPTQVDSTVALLDAGNTIPFIARYRKEATGSLDDQVLRDLSDRLTYLRSLQKRQKEILTSIEEQGKLTPELLTAIEGATTLAEAEDLYRPYRPKRKTRASAAREKGLEPLAVLLLAQQDNIDVVQEAAAFVEGDADTGDASPVKCTSIEEALQGAMDILAEDFSDDAALRKHLRQFLLRTARLTAKATDPEAETVYTMYYDFAEPVARIAPHRVLAIDRGEREEALKVSVQIEAAAAIALMKETYLISGGDETLTSHGSHYVARACEDSFARLMFPSLERELRATLTQNAAAAAITVFAKNLRQLLMQPPVKDTVVLGLDPAFRTGCKIAVVDGTGKVLDTTVIYPTPPQNKVTEATVTLTGLIRKHKVSAIAIGNGTASRESEAFVARLIQELPDTQLAYMIVNEAGASVYSASKLAAAEFPQFDVSIRSAVSIARRMQDPLAELVKINPKSIGVGQYQHDMPKTQLEEALDGVVESCVNSVGVDLNTASHALLRRVAGINESVAKNIVAYREENGVFTNRRQLLKVNKLGPKAFEQCVGFLRIPGGDNPLDNTGVHPESYGAAENLLKECGILTTKIAQGVQNLKELTQQQGLRTLAQKLNIGEPTLKDIIADLQKPGRDPRDELPKPLLRTDVLSIADLKVGMELTGTVRNAVDFGVFVDIGVHEDGLVHISQICERYIKHPLEAVKVGDVVTVWVLGVEEKRNRISLTMKKPA
ncbi:MAG: RNA-binding transcriptional accessory protein [Peptococcaceae bacterium]|nr:RNA-binding transcriptional accessory protein [Peptococcaceae bacterium]